MNATTQTRLALMGGPLLGLILFLCVRNAGLSMDAAWTAAITGVCAVWWVIQENMAFSTFDKRPSG